MTAHAHHFDSPAAEFESGKFGMWVFLATEILFFGGLFCAYAVYRSNHPEIFYYGHKYLNPELGALNTCILLFSSFTMAWGVRAAQLGQRRLLIALLAATIACGFAFMGVKFIEYEHKWKYGILPGKYFQPAIKPGEHGPAQEAPAGEIAAPPQEALAAPASAPAPAPASGEERTLLPGAAAGPEGLAPAFVEALRATDSAIARPGKPSPADPKSKVQLFFSIYFVMTGLHGIHVIGGLAVIAWLIRRALRGDFGPANFAAVDFTGLYWHLVDLIWIFLFPLLYLIH